MQAMPPEASAQEGSMAWIVSVIALVVFCAAPAQAQTYPAKPIHILVPYAPGGVPSGSWGYLPRAGAAAP